MHVLLITPPMTQLNTPYPATAYLSGFLKSKNYQVSQCDLSLELALKLFNKTGLQRVHSDLKQKFSKVPLKKRPQSVQFFMENYEAYSLAVEPVVTFLQNKDPSLALRIVSREFLPEGPQFAALRQFEGQEDDQDSLSWAFGVLGNQDRAKYLASLMINDLARVVSEGLDSRFSLARFAESLAASQAQFDPIYEALKAEPTLIDHMIDELTSELLTKHNPDVVGLSTPFPGNVYGAFRVAKVVKKFNPQILTVWGGGYVNTELRSLSEPRVFEFFDRVVLDDGYAPFLALLENRKNPRSQEKFLRTYVCHNNQVSLQSNPALHDIAQKDVGTPSYVGLDLTRYLSIFEMLNPMHRIWADGRWNKLTVAQGCYWKKCSFCDIGLDYIGRYEPNQAEVLVDRIEQLMAETKASGFHFVDEAAPPAVLKSLAQELIRRKVVITWWGNIRFEKSFTPELCQLLAKSGCVAISGGLEVASDRLLEKMKKGVSVEQVARVTRSFTDAGIMVHAYLMYGFPTQTVQETVDSLERVRQLFEQGCLQSAYWHRFAATAHSPVGLNPQEFGIEILESPKVKFSHNDLDFVDPTGIDHDMFSAGLKKSLYNYMHGVGFDRPVHQWFEGLRLPKTKVTKSFIAKALSLG